ncbi:MAG: YidC/Oxa1 family membrane protein insertase [Treponema sp.]|jgi:YidC/Oxa1 family membrane protein insertase|nr:YidC/Oxa1 family membrane protein insertase [Treponema sp.]
MNILFTVIIYPITQILEFSFVFSQKLFRESGISIIFISIVISVLLLPLYAVAEKWQQIERDIQKKLKSKIDKIKKVFKGDEQYMILSTFYKQNHYHPVYALRSTFGLLIQIPFFIAAYSFLSHLEIIKGVSFLFIKDLSSPDGLLSIGGFSINLLPFVMTFINCLSGLIYSRGLPGKDKIQIFLIAFIFLILLYNMPSALVLYWTMNNIFSVVKNIYYKIHLKYKFHALIVLFSFFCILLAVFCMTKYSYISKARTLTAVCFFTAFIPWVFVFLKDKFTKIIKIEYEYKKSLSIFLVSIFLMFSLFGLFIPSQLIASSPQEFSFIDNYTNPLFFIFNTSLQVLGLFVFWPICIYFLFSNSIKKYFSVVFLAVSLSLLVNVFLFPDKYGMISINFIFDGSIKPSNKEILLNLCVLLVPIALAVILYLSRNRNIVLTLISLCIFSLVSISAVNIYKINSSFSELKKYYVNEQKKVQEISPITSLSRNGKNIVIINLDRGINVFVPFIFEEAPELKEIYSGFTYYPNTVSFNGFTRIGSPPVFGGYDYTPEEVNKRENTLLVEKHNEALVMLPRILSENDFSVCVTDPPYANYNWRSDLSIFDDYPDINARLTDSVYTDLWLSEHNFKLPETSDIIKRNMLWYSLLKGMPVFIRQSFYMDGDWYSPANQNSLRLSLNGYSVLDYISRLVEISDDNKNTALIMTNNTTHENSYMQAPEYVPVKNVTEYGTGRFSKEPAYHINIASLKRLATWFELLKRENVYDNTRIILVSDHGPPPNFVTKIGLPFNVDHFNPLLMVKDFNADGEIKTDMSFMSNADVPYLSLINIIDNPVNPFTGNKISVERKREPLYIAISGSVHISGRIGTQYKLNPEKDYYVHDNIFSAENWTPVSNR